MPSDSAHKQPVCREDAIMHGVESRNNRRLHVFVKKHHMPSCINSDLQHKHLHVQSDAKRSYHSLLYVAADWLISSWKIEVAIFTCIRKSDGDAMHGKTACNGLLQTHVCVKFCMLCDIKRCSIFPCAHSYAVDALF